MRDLLWQLDRARAALAEGRSRAGAKRQSLSIASALSLDRSMRPEFETFLARLYTRRLYVRGSLPIRVLRRNATS
jgi:hypothetical protein